MGERGVDLGGYARGVEDDLERLAAGLVAQAGDPRRLGALRAGTPQGSLAIEFAGVAGQCPFRFLQRAQPASLEIGQRPFRARLRLRDSRATD